ncbi:type IV toxin-antitoxin system AbiEi family antitoxin [Budvicia diplopodorum]|uniref:type IV toxin-antitoxin system AbiEi family antitoxin n=1 Tax=Budvicia diplopodorum TaxID=1119056 RepID=UPI00135A2090|nr:type IV toxin-antitoxin system AbiEi family antitoxin [Budvicia diplopodorum]
MNEALFLSEVVKNLPRDFQLRYELNNNRDFRDGCAKFSTPNGEVFTFSLEIKHIHRKETLMAVRRQMDNQPILLICNPLTPALVEYCVSNQLNFIDTSGNARIHTKGFHVFIDGRGSKAKRIVDNRISEGTLKLLFVLLSAPETLNNNYRALAELSGISLGMVSKAFGFLENKRLYRNTANGRRLMNVEELQILWLRDYATAIRSKLAFIPLTAPDKWQDILLETGELWGGEAAATQLSDGYLIPENWTLFTPHFLQHRVKALGLTPLRGGKLRLVSAFWGPSFQLNRTAEVMLCMAELLVSKDDRNLAVARIINEKYLHLDESALFNY